MFDVMHVFQGHNMVDEIKDLTYGYSGYFEFQWESNTCDLYFNDDFNDGYACLPEYDNYKVVFKKTNEVIGHITYPRSKKLTHHEGRVEFIKKFIGIALNHDYETNKY